MGGLESNNRGCVIEKGEGPTPIHAPDCEKGIKLKRRIVSGVPVLRKTVSVVYLMCRMLPPVSFTVCEIQEGPNIPGLASAVSSLPSDLLVLEDSSWVGCFGFG